MSLGPRGAAALLVGTGGAGAATALALLAGDLTGGLGPQARVAALGFAFLLTLPLALAVSALLKPGSGSGPRIRAFASLGTLLWLGGLGGDLFNPTQAQGAPLLLAAHSMALVGGLALAGAGLVGRPLAAQP